MEAVDSPRVRADALSLTTDSMGAIVMYNYPVLECLAAFAVVFLIGFLCGRSKHLCVVTEQEESCV